MNRSSPDMRLHPSVNFRDHALRRLAGFSVLPMGTPGSATRESAATAADKVETSACVS